MSALQQMRTDAIDYLESLETEVNALHCISGLLNGIEPGANTINLNELCCLIDPIIERQKNIVDEMRVIFNVVWVVKK